MTTRKRKRVEFLLALLGAAATAVLFVVFLFGPTLAANKANSLIRDRLDDLVTRQGLNPVELMTIVDHPVERVCVSFGYGFSYVRDVAENYGIEVDVPPNTQTPERRYGIFVIGPDNATYGALHWDVFTPPSGPDCHTGGRLAIQFDDTYPLSGGRLVDLDAPDLRPAMIEQ